MATSTAGDVIKDALHLLRVIDEEEGPTANQSARGLRVMNQMMHGWNTIGIQYVHTDLALTDTVNVPDEQILNVGLVLARALSLSFGKVLGKTLEDSIMTAENGLRSFYYKVKPAASELSLQGGRRPGGYVSIDRF